jgi:Tfp pilus assembly protein PilO
MHKLLLQRRNRLILIGAATVAAVGLVWFLLIYPLRAQLRVKTAELTEVQGRQKNARRSARLAEDVRTDLAAALDQLAEAETGVARGDIYRWMVNLLLDFGRTHRVVFDKIGQPTVADLEIPPKLPYQGAVFEVSGSGTYRDFGRFLADFENRFRLIRLQSLELEPASYVETDSNQPIRLSFRLNFLVLVKPSGTSRR